MTLTLARPPVAFRWNGPAIDRGVELAAARGVAGMAQDAILAIQPATPVESGSLLASIHPARPGFSENEDERYRRRKADAGRPQAWRTDDILPFVVDLAVWVGSWLSYAYPVERGYYNAWAKANIPGQNFIGPNAEAAVRSPGTRFAYHFNEAWGEYARTMRAGSP